MNETINETNAASVDPRYKIFDDPEEERIFQEKIEADLAKSAAAIRASLKRRPDSKEIKRLSVIAADKASDQGIRSLSADERRYYAYYLTTHSYKVNARGEATRPIHAALADLVLLDMIVFILNGDAYIYNEDNGTFERDSDGKRVRARIRPLLEFELREDKTISAIYNLILSDEKLTITDKQINRRPKNWIHFLNGYYDFQAGKFEEHDPKYHEISVIPWEYSPSRYPENYRFIERGSGLLRETVEEPLLFNAWLDAAIPEPEDQEMLLQYIGYSMTLETGAQKFMMICGSGGTGKSTLLSVIEAILGRSNISSVSLQGLQERFTPGELYLKQANICADIPLTALSEVDIIKKLTGEDLISADRKFKSNFLFRSYARLYFSANDIPVNLSDKSNAFYRRMLILKMEHIPAKVDPDLAEKLKTEIPNIITRAVEALSRSNGAIVESERSKELVKEAHKNSDTVEAFLDDRCEYDEKEKINRVDLYAAYFNYCVNEGRKSVTKSNFYKQLDNKGFPSRRNKNNYDIVGLRLSNIVPIPTKNAAVSS